MNIDDRQLSAMASARRMRSLILRLQEKIVELAFVRTY
jgi:hypothetical protein